MNAHQQPAETLDATFVEFFKALADTGRLRVAGAIAAAPRTAGEVAAALSLPISTVSRHLARLVASELAITEGEGAAARYTWNELHVRALSSAHLESPRQRALAGASDERSRVLASFMRDGRLTRMPTGDTRKLVILEYVVERFDAERTYTEREVNAILKEIADDYTTIRRALVDYLFLNRHQGVYWVARGRRDQAMPEGTTGGDAEGSGPPAEGVFLRRSDERP